VKRTRRSKRTNYWYDSNSDIWDDDGEGYTSSWENLSDRSSGKSYYDNLQNEISDNWSGWNTPKTQEKFHYESLKQELYRDHFTSEEIDKLDEQYFRLDSKYDENYVSYFREDYSGPFT
jgi:hypothetical protein